MALTRVALTRVALTLAASVLMLAAGPPPVSGPQSPPVRFRDGSSGLSPAYTPLVSLTDGTFPAVALGDFDNDDDLDIFLTNNGNPSILWPLIESAASRPGESGRGNFLYRNDGDTDGDGIPNFTDVAAEAGVLGLPAIGSGALFVDLDNDGDLELLVASKLRGVTFSEFGLHAPDRNIRLGGFRDSSGSQMPPVFQPDTPEGQLNGEFVVAPDPVTGQPRGEGRNTLYRNMLVETGKATFVDVTGQAGDIGGTTGEFPGGRSASGVAAADVDGDGYVDVFVANAIDPDFWNLKGRVSPTGQEAADGEHLFCNGQTNRLYLNRGDLSFTDVTDAAGVAGARSEFYEYTGHRRDAYAPDLKDVRGNPVGEPAAVTWGATFSDFDLDGDPDLWTASDVPGKVELFRNDSTPGVPRFSPIGDLSGLRSVGQWMGIATGDFDRDGDFDTFVSNYGGSVYLRSHNTDPAQRRLQDDVGEWYRWQSNANLHGFLRNDGVLSVRRGGEREAVGRFPNVIQTLDVRHSRWLPPPASDPLALSPQKRLLFGGGPLEFAWGVVAFDANGDGWLDFYFAGSLGTEENAGRFLVADGPYRYVDLTVEAHVLNVVGADYDNVDAGLAPAPEDRILQSPRPTNEMAGAIATGDFDNDGFEDFIVVNTGGWLGRRPNAPVSASGRPLYQPGNAMIFLNEGTANHWLRLRLEGGMRPGDKAGSGKSPRTPFGARVTAYLGPPHEGEPPLVRELVAGHSYLAQSSSELHFGLGAATRVTRLLVNWPSGKVEEFLDVPADRTLRIREGAYEIELITSPRAQSRP